MGIALNQHRLEYSIRADEVLELMEIIESEDLSDIDEVLNLLHFIWEDYTEKCKDLEHPELK